MVTQRGIIYVYRNVSHKFHHPGCNLITNLIINELHHFHGIVVSVCVCVCGIQIDPLSGTIPCNYLCVKGIWILGLALFPILIIWFNTESILLLIQQDPCVAR